MDSSSPTPAASRTEKLRIVAWGLLRAFLSVVILLALYFYGPLDGLRVLPLSVTLIIACGLLVLLGAWQVQRIVTARYPALQAIEGLAIMVPLYILLFASTYYVMAAQDAGAFDVGTLTRVDALYFTVTTFATVGFGDITAVSQTGRVFVTVQMILNLLVLGAGIRVFVGAVRRRRGSDIAESSPPPASAA